MKIKVIYGQDRGVVVFIDDTPYGTKQATEKLFGSKVMASLRDREENRPMGLFAPRGFMMHVKSQTSQYAEEEHTPKIDYNRISPLNLEKRLKSRIHALKDQLFDIAYDDIEIECIRKDSE
jgi:hypothetical protein